MGGGQTILAHPQDDKQPKTFAFDHSFYSTDIDNPSFASEFVQSLNPTAVDASHVSESGYSRGKNAADQETAGCTHFTQPDALACSIEGQWMHEPPW